MTQKPTLLASTFVAALAAALVLTGCGGTVSNAGSAAPETAAESPASTTPNYAEQLQHEIPELMAQNAIPGVIAYVRSPQNGDWAASFGTGVIGEDAPMGIDDVFRVGSNTKTMTSTVMLQLVSEGKLSLDDPISKYIDGVPNGELITIANLSEMRSGLVSYSFDPQLNATLDADPDKAWQPQELLDIAFAYPVNAEPGTEYEYSNTNIVLLGLVIEQLTGMSASEAFAERIFEPLGMTNSLLPDAAQAELAEPHGEGYQFGTNVETIDSYAVPAADLDAALDGTLLPGVQTNANPSWAWTAGGAISNAPELADYAEALVAGGLLDEATQNIRLDSIQATVAGGKNTVGYGLGLVEFAPGIYGHDGQLPGYSSFMVHNLETGDTIIIACNLSASPVDGQNAAVVMGKAFIGAMYGSADLPDPAKAGS